MRIFDMTRRVDQQLLSFTFAMMKLTTSQRPAAPLRPEAHRWHDKSSANERKFETLRKLRRVVSRENEFKYVSTSS
jgi:hypothetical protein